MNTPVKDVGLVVFGILLFISVFMTLQKVETYLKVKSINDCAKAATSTTVEGGFNGAVYKICVEDSGYKTQIK